MSGIRILPLLVPKWVPDEPELIAAHLNQQLVEIAKSPFGVIEHTIQVRGNDIRQLFIVARVSNPQREVASAETLGRLELAKGNAQSQSGSRVGQVAATEQSKEVGSNAKAHRVGAPTR